jgi:transketolase C-terminal domain/subunit
MDNHYRTGGQGDRVADLLASGLIKGKTLTRIALNELPVSGTNSEVLAHHKLNLDTVLTTIINQILS